MTSLEEIVAQMEALRAQTLIITLSREEAQALITLLAGKEEFKAIMHRIKARQDIPLVPQA